MRVMLLGATGLVGGLTLPRLLDDPRCSAVIAPTRRPLGAAHGKLENPVLAFDALPAAAGWAGRWKLRRSSAPAPNCAK